MTTSINITARLEGRIHENDLIEIANLAADNADGLIDTLLHHVFDESDDLITKKVSDNATWVIQHLHKKDFEQFVLPQKGELIKLAIRTHSESKQRMILSILRETEFSKDKLETEFIDFCLSTMMSCAHSVGTRSLCIHLAFKQCKHYPELVQELKQQLDLMDDELLQPSLKSAKNTTLIRIKKLVYEELD